MRIPAPVAAIHVKRVSAAGLRLAHPSTMMGHKTAKHAKPTKICFSIGTAPGSSKVTPSTMEENRHNPMTLQQLIEIMADMRSKSWFLTLRVSSKEGSMYKKRSTLLFFYSDDDQEPSSLESLCASSSDEEYLFLLFLCCRSAGRVFLLLCTISFCLAACDWTKSPQ